MTAYYNEINPYAAQWLRNLIAAGYIADGDVDERDIKDVTADDLVGYDYIHSVTTVIVPRGDNLPAEYYAIEVSN